MKDDTISRAAAIDAIQTEADEAKEVWSKFDDESAFGEMNAHSRDIDIIKRLPSAQPETEERTAESAQNVPNDELISRKAAIDAIAKAMPSLTTPDGCGEFDHDIYVTDEAYVDCMQIIHELPSAQPERKRGRWIYGEDNLGTGRDGWFCSECGHFELWDYSADMKSAELNLPNYCPNCGADMRGEQDG